MSNYDGKARITSSSKNEYGAVLYVIADNEYRFLTIENEENSKSFFRVTSEKEMTASELENVIREKTGVKVKIDKWIGRFLVEYSNGTACTFLIGQVNDDSNAINGSLMNYVQTRDILADPNDKEVLEEFNWRLIVQKSAVNYLSHGRQHFDFTCLPYLPLKKDEEAEIIEMIQEYEKSDLYEYIHKCARVIRYLYGNSKHLEDYHHNDRKYLRELIFHVEFWYPTYLDWQESRKNK